MIKGWGVPGLLLILVLALRPHMAGGTYPFSQGLLLIPVLVALALVLLSLRDVIGARRHREPLHLLLWVLVSWSFMTLLWAPDPGQGVREGTALLCNITIFTLVYFLVQEEGVFHRATLPVLGLVTVPVLASALYQRMFGLARIREALREMDRLGADVTDLALIITDNRVFAGFLNPNMLAGFLAVTICVTVDLLLTTVDRRRFLTLSALAAGQFAVLVLTGSVGGSAVAVAMAGAVILVRGRFRFRELAVAFTVLVLVAGGVLALRGGDFLFGPESSLLQRGWYMAAGLRMALLHPFLGWGSGSSPGALMGFVSSGVRPVADPHNFLVRSWISWGVPGLILIGGFLIYWTVTVLRPFTTGDRRLLPAGYAGLVFGGAAFLGHSMMDMDFFVPETALSGWCAMGAAAGLAAAGKGRAAPAPSRSRNSLTTAVAGVLLFLVLPAFVYVQGESLAFRAGKAAAEGDHRTAVDQFRDARGLLPMNGRFALEEGRVRRAMGEEEKAMELFLKAGSLMRASPYPPWEIGRLKLAAGDWSGSIPPLEKALSRFRTSPRIRLDLARGYLGLGDLEEVSRLLREARRLSMFDPQAGEMAREILSRMGR